MNLNEDVDDFKHRDNSKGWVINVGKMDKKKAEKYLKELVEKFKKKIIYEEAKWDNYES